MTDETCIEQIAQRLAEEVGWSRASTAPNQYGFVDIVTHLFCEKGLRRALLESYRDTLAQAQFEAQQERGAYRMEDR